MTCTVTVIALRLPERFAADGINHRAFDVFRENGFRQRNMCFQHQSVIALHGRTRIADRHHARDVGRTAPVLAAGVNQQHTVAFDFAVVFRCRAVMRQGGIGIVAGDGVETWRNKAGTLAAVFVEHAVDVQLAQFAAVCQDLFKLGKEAAQCRAVFRHGIADMGDVGIGFD